MTAAQLVRRRCNARRSDGEPCNKPPIQGGAVCATHGGSLKRVKDKAKVRAEIMNWGLGDTNVDPGVILLRMVTQSAARAQRYAEELEDHVRESPTLRAALVAQAYGEFGPTGEYIRGLAQLEAQERDRCVNFATKAVAAGLAERTVRLAEKQGEMIAAVLRAVLGDPTLGLTEAQLSAAPMIIEQHVNAILE